MAAPELIAVCGHAGAGKDAVAEVLVRRGGFVRLSVAAPLKDAVAAMFGWDRALLEGASPRARAWREAVDPWWSARLDDPAFTPRRALQAVGTEAVRDRVHADVWLAALERRLDALPPGARVVVSDVRFGNELEALRARGAHVWVVERAPSGGGSDEPAAPPCRSEGDWQQSAGQGACGGVTVIANMGTLEELEDAVCAEAGIAPPRELLLQLHAHVAF